MTKQNDKDHSQQGPIIVRRAVYNAAQELIKDANRTTDDHTAGIAPWNLTFDKMMDARETRDLNLHS